MCKLERMGETERAELTPPLRKPPPAAKRQSPLLGVTFTQLSYPGCLLSVNGGPQSDEFRCASPTWPDNRDC